LIRAAGGDDLMVQVGVLRVDLLNDIPHTITDHLGWHGTFQVEFFAIQAYGVQRCAQIAESLDVWITGAYFCFNWSRSAITFSPSFMRLN